MRPLLARLLLAFMLVFSQLGGMAHAVSHFGADADTKHLPADRTKNCSVCQAFSAASAVAPPAASPAPLTDAEHVLRQSESWSAATLDSFFTFARGPPRHPDA